MSAPGERQARRVCPLPASGHLRRLAEWHGGRLQSQAARDCAQADCYRAAGRARVGRRWLITVDDARFGKLFVNLLDHEFQRQPDSTAAPKTLITDLFEGQMRYRTRCKSCNTGSDRNDVFTELSINLAVRQ